MKIRELDDQPCQLGEGPLWDAADEVLYWVDSLAPALFCHDLSNAVTRRWTLPGKSVGSLAVRERGGLLLAMDRGIYSFDCDTGAIELVIEPLAGTEGLRLNDGKVDPYGNFVTGAMNIDYRETANCSMYRLSPGWHLEKILDGFTCFNGPCFNENGDRLYLTGREEGVIEIFDYTRDLLPCNGRVLRAGCNPDGATVDAEGYLWSAQWDDACILRFDPEYGRIDARIDFPGQVVSSLMFGGPRLDLIFVTTTAASVCGVSAVAPRPGRVLVVSDSGFRGRAEPRFAD